jgi:hypothetical protein
MMRFLFCVCFLDFSPFPLFFFDIILPRRLVVEADALFGVADIDLHYSFPLSIVASATMDPLHARTSIVVRAWLHPLLSRTQA